MTIIEDLLLEMIALGRAKLGNCPNPGWRDDVSGEMEMLSHPGRGEIGRFPMASCGLSLLLLLLSISRCCD